MGGIQKGLGGGGGGAEMGSNEEMLDGVER